MHSGGKRFSTKSGQRITNRKVRTNVTIVDPNNWQPLYSYISFQRSPEADFEVDGRPYGVFTHDWRAEPVPLWLEVMAEHERSTGTRPDFIETKKTAPIVVLSQIEFAEAVRQALRDYTRPDKLSANPLLRSRLVIEATEENPLQATIQILLRKAAQALTGKPKDEKLYRAIYHTYLDPAPTQEQAAELLDLPFNTYRYQLSQGLKRITSWLWQKELL